LRLDPDGRRVFASNSIVANSPNVIWVDDSIPAGAQPGSDSGDSWNWVSASPTPYSGQLAQQSGNIAGEHQVFFDYATATLTVQTNDTLYAWIYLDPANPPAEAMLQWNDGTWEHRAYWGANDLTYGTDGTVTRTNMGALPATGKWSQLTVPAASVNLAGSTLTGMAFTLFNGRATWDCAGLLSPMTVATNSGNPGQLSGSTVPLISIQMTGTSPTFSWAAQSGGIYRVLYKNNLTDPSWTAAVPDLTASDTSIAWTDSTTATQRFYVVMRIQ